MTNSAPSPTATEAESRLHRFLKGIPKTVALVDAAVAALSALLLPKVLIPTNLDALGASVGVLVILCLFVTVRYSQAVHHNLAKLILVAGLALLGLVSLHVTAVCTVPGYGGVEKAPHYLVGFTLTPEGQSAATQLGSKSCTDLISGAGASRIPVMWGRSYTIGALLYVVTYGAFLVGAVLAFGGAVLGRTASAIGKQGS